MKMRKLIALICALSMVLGIFAACQTPTEQPTETPTATPIVTPTPEEPTVTPEPTEEPVVTPTPTETPEPTPEATPYPALESTVETSDKSTWPEQDPAVIGFEQPSDDEYADWAKKGLVGKDDDKKECWIGTTILAEGTDPDSIDYLIIPDTVEINGETYTVVGIAWDLMGWHQYGGGVGFGQPNNPNNMSLHLQELYIPKTIRYIDYQILMNWNGLQNVIFEDSSTLEYIGHLAFTNTPYENNKIAESEQALHIIGDMLVFVGAAYEIQIPTGVRVIAGRIFNQQSGIGDDFYRELIESITIPETVEHIEGNAFQHLDNAEFVFRVKEGSYADTWLKGAGYTNVEYFE